MRRTLLALVVVFAAACGGASADSDAPLVAVDPALAPVELSGGLKLYESATDETREAFANAGEDSLQADGRLWEIREGANLVGALQISTVKPKVDLVEARRRDLIVDEILVGAYDRIRVGGVEVYASGANDKVIYLWFGTGLFEVLQLKGDELDHEAVLGEVLAHQQAIPSWSPLAIDVEAEADG